MSRGRWGRSAQERAEDRIQDYEGELIRLRMQVRTLRAETWREAIEAAARAICPYCSRYGQPLMVEETIHEIPASSNARPLRHGFIYVPCKSTAIRALKNPREKKDG